MIFELRKNLAYGMAALVGFGIWPTIAWGIYLGARTSGTWLLLSLFVVPQPVMGWLYYPFFFYTWGAIVGCGALTFLVQPASGTD